VGLNFTTAFDRWRHDAEAVAQLIAVATGHALGARCGLDGSITVDDANEFQRELGERCREIDAPWLNELLASTE
jgi:hypothetical protein